MSNAISFCKNFVILICLPQEKQITYMDSNYHHCKIDNFYLFKTAN